MTRPNKLECLYLVITFQFSLTFAVNTTSLPKKEATERRSNWVGSGLALKFKYLTQKGFQGQTSLLGLVVNDEGKKFYNVDHRKRSSGWSSNVGEWWTRSETGSGSDRRFSNEGRNGETGSWNRSLIFYSGNTDQSGRLSTVDLLIKVACFLTKVDKNFSVKMSWSVPVSTRRLTVLSIPL